MTGGWVTLPVYVGSHVSSLTLPHGFLLIHTEYSTDLGLSVSPGDSIALGPCYRRDFWEKSGVGFEVRIYPGC